MDKIYIRDLEFIGYHGVFEEEKKLGQKFFVSLELTTNLREAGLNDDITKTTHYGEVSESVKKIFFQKKYDLIETLAEDIAREILLNYPLISELKLEIKKPWAPVGIPLKDVSVEIRRKWNEVYISLGSNMGNKRENLEKAIKEVAKIKDTFIIKESKIIETEPFGYKEQDDFLNSCIGVKTLLAPREILKELLAIEIRMGRERKIKWGPRIIDLDIIFYGKEVIEEEDLIVPHPYMEYREFVLKPLEEIIPNFVNKEIILGERTLVMGILNVTPDSFSDGGKYNNLDSAIKQAEKLILDGADIIDVGGESTRPGHIQISSEEEISRVVPIIEKISKNLDTVISIDTYKYNVAEEAIKAGANIINDIWGLQYDNGEMAELVKKSSLPIIVMHNQNDEIYSKDIMLSLREFFEKTYKIADKYGIDRDKIILDPGLGFGKNAEQNIEVLSRLNELKDMGPILLGASKKRFIGKLLNDLPFDERVEGTVATTVIGIEKGVDIVRVHNVLENKRACLVADGIYRKRG